MHDPKTVAFDIKSPFVRVTSHGFRLRDSIITIWHVDPEKRGHENSCDWHGTQRELNEKERAIVDAMWRLGTLLDNRPFFPDHPAHKEFKNLKNAVREWQRRRARLHPRWHVWHWKIQIHAVQNLKRWLFSRCVLCGKRFRWGEAPVSNQWHSQGPRWFRGEEGCSCGRCYPSGAK